MSSVVAPIDGGSADLSSVLPGVVGVVDLELDGAASAISSRLGGLGKVKSPVGVIFSRLIFPDHITWTVTHGQ